MSTTHPAPANLSDWARTVLSQVQRFGISRDCDPEPARELVAAGLVRVTSKRRGGDPELGYSDCWTVRAA